MRMVQERKTDQTTEVYEAEAALIESLNKYLPIPATNVKSLIKESSFYVFIILVSSIIFMIQYFR